MDNYQGCSPTGGYGQAVKGLYRVHQFSKVELFAVTSGEEGEGGGEGGGEDGEGGREGESEKMLQEMVRIQEEICSDLGLHYR